MEYTGNRSWAGQVDINTRQSGQQTISFTLKRFDNLKGRVVEKMLLDLGATLGSDRGFGRVTSVMVSSTQYSLLMSAAKFETMVINADADCFLIGNHSLDLSNISIMFAYSTPTIEIDEII